MSSFPRTKPIGRATNAAVPTTGTAFTLPLTAPRLVRIETDGDAYIGVGSVDTPIPAASTSNSVYHSAGEHDYYFDGVPSTDGSYIYVYAVSTTIVAKLSYFN